MYYYIKTKHFFMEIIIYTCFATDEDGRAVENFCNTLFKCNVFLLYKNKKFNVLEEII